MALDDFSDGVFFVPLARVSDPNLVGASLAQALDVREAADLPLLDSLAAALREKHLLLILDNFEHVAGAATLVADLLGRCPGLKVMATSRAVLGLHGEREFQVPPLTLPDPERLPSKEQLAQYEAVRLFVERAQDINPGFVISDANARAVAEICVSLDGLPLAIELAAARTRLLSPEAMLARLDRPLSLLTGGARDRPARQQTLRKAIDWSYDLLDGAEQTLFRQLAVFVGGGTLGAAEAVCDPTGDYPATGMQVLDGLESLAAKSLLRLIHGDLDGHLHGHLGGGQGHPEGPGLGRPVADETRFVMAQTIREYALDRLQASGEDGRIRRRHATFYARLAEVAAPELRGAQQAIWFERLFQDRSNLRTALRWAIEHDETETALRLGGTLWYFWHVQGYLTEGREWLATVLALPGTAAPSAFRATALVGLGVLTGDQGDERTARAILGEGVALARALGNRRDLGSALAWLAYVIQQSDPEVAGQAFEEALAIGRALEDKALVARALNGLGEVSRLRGDYQGAAAVYADALVIARETGHQHRIASINHNLGQIALQLGDAPRAATCFAESLTILRALGDRRVVAHCVAGLAGVATVQGRAARSARLCGVAEALLAALGARLDPADRLAYDRYTSAARAHLGDAAFATAVTKGRAMPPDQALDYALALDS